MWLVWLFRTIIDAPRGKGAAKESYEFEARIALLGYINLC